IGFYDPFSEYFPEIEELSYISSSWSTETNKVTDQFDYAYYIYTNPLFKGDVANYLSDDNFHPNNKGYTKIANETLKDRKSTRLNSSHVSISYAVFCLKKKKKKMQ